VPALQSSGAISLNNIKTLFGGVASPSLGDYYRNSSYIRSYSQNSTHWLSTDSGYFELYWGGANIVPQSSGWSPTMTSYTTGGYTYFKGDVAANDSGYGGSGYVWNYVYRVLTTLVSANGVIPTSGPISMRNFYGAEKP